MNQLKQVHAFSLRNGTVDTNILITKLLEIPNIPYARQLFDLIPQPTSSLYNKLIKAYASHGPQHHCFSLYTQMFKQSCFPDPLTFTYIFSVCAALSSARLGKIVHGHFVVSGFKDDVIAVTALVDMYAKLGLVEFARVQFDQLQYKAVPVWNAMIAGYARRGKMEEARTLFELMPSKTVVSWTTMVSGYSQNGQYVNALNTFLSMEKVGGFMPNEVSLTSVLPACANLGALEIGERIEGYARVNGYIENLFVSNALLEMYAKCGKLDVAMLLFDEIRGRKNLCSWNTMIMGLATHGKYEKALKLFHQLLREKMVPDAITFVAALLACTHGGKIGEGKEIFELMETKFKIIPKLEHYGCMVDLLGRAGKLNEAYNLVQNMPMKPDAVIWGTLLGACSFHRNIEFAEKAAEALFRLEPWNSGNYVILSNIYASKNDWDGVSRTRKMMKGSQVPKAAGYSSIEESGVIHKFIVEDKSHPRFSEIYAALEYVYSNMRASVDENNFDSEIETTA
ncbi:pentatricopeptide repeat-containing protein At5g08510 [Silene latifolia]|uniref:pentatricopeptide repeat-containing protein At5g08510 n=1 Tax=Silene latifolia TaxID=37657 RepID=UPI003D77CF02